MLLLPPLARPQYQSQVPGAETEFLVINNTFTIETQSCNSYMHAKPLSLCTRKLQESGNVVQYFFRQFGLPLSSPLTSGTSPTWSRT